MDVDSATQADIIEKDIEVCYAPKMIQSKGIWVGDHPLAFSFPLFLLQLLLIVVVSRALYFLLKPFRQPRVISEIMTGIILGPSVLGRSKEFVKVLFPLRSAVVLETIANFGLLYFLFLVGVEMGLSTVVISGRKAVVIAFAGMILPFILGCIASIFIHDESNIHMNETSYVILFSVCISVTAFPVLARILAEIKLLNRDIGRLAMSAAIINDLFAWVLLAFAMTSAQKKSVVLAPLWVILCSIFFVLFCIYCIQPVIIWLVKQTPEGEVINEISVYLILSGVMVSGFITEAIGAHPAFGAFIYGLMIPSGPLGFIIIEKLEDFVTGILLPLFFANSGLKTDIAEIKGVYNWVILLIVIVLGCIGKVGGTVIVSQYYQMPLSEAITLGFLMNCKGLFEMIVLSIATEHNILDKRSYAIMVIAALVLTALITPVVTVIYKPVVKSEQHAQRAIQMSGPDTELRLLVCIHSPRDVPTMIKLLEASHPSTKSQLFVHVLHLIELTGRASSMLTIHTTPGPNQHGQPVINRILAQTDHIFSEFKNFEKQNCGCVSVETLTAISSYSTMHQDINNLAEDKQVAMIIIPFHMHQTVDGGMASMNPEFQLVNQNLLANKECSVGILVDRGLSLSLQIVMLFFGGSDDREALSYAIRMARHPDNALTVIRFLPGKKCKKGLEENSREKHFDDECIKRFMGNEKGNASVTYTEKLVNNGEETVAQIGSVKNVHDLFIVGRREGIISPLTQGLGDWAEYPELGGIGDLLASPDFSTTISVLIVQQCTGVQEEIVKATSLSTLKSSRYKRSSV